MQREISAFSIIEEGWIESLQTTKNKILLVNGNRHSWKSGSPSLLPNWWSGRTSSKEKGDLMDVNENKTK